MDSGHFFILNKQKWSYQRPRTLDDRRKNSGQDFTQTEENTGVKRLSLGKGQLHCDIAIFSGHYLTAQLSDRRTNCDHISHLVTLIVQPHRNCADSTGQLFWQFTSPPQKLLPPRNGNRHGLRLLCINIWEYSL